MQTTDPKAKSFLSILSLFIIVLWCVPAAADDAPRIQTDKDVYAVGEKIQVNFYNAPGKRGDWICVVPVGSPDTEAGDYDYIPKGQSEGAIIIQTALAPGNYEARAFYNYGRKGYVVSARYRFSVGGGSAPSPALPAPPTMTTPPVTAALPAPAVESFKPDDKTSRKSSSAVIGITVFHFTPRSMDAAKYGLTVSETLINAPAIRSSFAVMGRRDLENFLSRNNLQQDDQTENIVDIGNRLGLNFVIAGTVEKHGTMIFTNCKVVNVSKGKVIFQKRFVSMGEADMVNNVAKISDDIAESIRKNAE